MARGDEDDATDVPIASPEQEVAALTESGVAQEQAEELAELLEELPPDKREVARLRLRLKAMSMKSEFRWAYPPPGFVEGYSPELRELFLEMLRDDHRLQIEHGRQRMALEAEDVRGSIELRERVVDIQHQESRSERTYRYAALASACLVLLCVVGAAAAAAALGQAAAAVALVSVTGALGASFGGVSIWAHFKKRPDAKSRVRRETRAPRGLTRAPHQGYRIPDLRPALA